MEYKQKLRHIIYLGSSNLVCNKSSSQPTNAQHELTFANFYEIDCELLTEAKTKIYTNMST